MRLSESFRQADTKLSQKSEDRRDGDSNPIQDEKENAFLLDGMLGSLARKLRILGFDTLFDVESDDKELIRIAKDTNRKLVTADMELYLMSRRKRIPSILISSRSERGRLYELLSKVGEPGIDLARLARCSVCNGRLENTGISDRDRAIYKCVDCGKNYWKGSHWKRLSSLFREVDLMLHSKKEVVQK
jgi:uncharacterized protein